MTQKYFFLNRNPNVQTETYWPRYTFLDQEVMFFKDNSMTVEESTHNHAVKFWGDIIPTAQARSCPLLPVASRLYYPDADDRKETSADAKALFLGSYIALPTAEYILFGLVVISVGLFVMSIALIAMFLRARKGDRFHRIS